MAQAERKMRCKRTGSFREIYISLGGKLTGEFNSASDNAEN